MNPKIKKRDIAFFVIGVVTFIVIELVSDWEANKKAFLKNMKDTEIENVKS